MSPRRPRNRKRMVADYEAGVASRVPLAGKHPAVAYLRVVRVRASDESQSVILTIELPSHISSSLLMCWNAMSSAAAPSSRPRCLVSKQLVPYRRVAAERYSLLICFGADPL
jgi:hypothetical protein